MADLTVKFFTKRAIDPGDTLSVTLGGVAKTCRVDTVRENRVRTVAQPTGDWTTEVDLTITN